MYLYSNLPCTQPHTHPCCTIGSLMGAPAISRNRSPSPSPSPPAASAAALPLRVAAAAVAVMWSPGPNTTACLRSTSLPLICPAPAQAQIHSMGKCMVTCISRGQCLMASQNLQRSDMAQPANRHTPVTTRASHSIFELKTVSYLA